MRAPLLDLSTLTENRPPIRIDGKIYHLKSADELTLLESQRFTTWGKALETLAADPDKHEELLDTVSQVASAALADVPHDVFCKLSSSQQMAIAEVFTGLLLRRRLAVAGALAQQLVARLPTGEKSSPGSSASSEAIPDTGSTAAPPAS